MWYILLLYIQSIPDLCKKCNNLFLLNIFNFSFDECFDELDSLKIGWFQLYNVLMSKYNVVNILFFGGFSRFN